MVLLFDAAFVYSDAASVILFEANVGGKNILCKG
jgi:hypothetical protein